MKQKKAIIITIITIALLAIAAITAIAIVNTTTAANSPAAMLSAAERYLRELDYEQAIIEFNRVIGIDPMNAEAYEGLIEAYEAIGDYDKAEEIRQKAYEVTGDSRFKKEKVTTGVTTTAAETTVPETTVPENEPIIIDFSDYATEEERAVAELIRNPDADIDQSLLDGIQWLEVYGKDFICVNRTLFDVLQLKGYTMDDTSFCIFLDDDTTAEYEYGNISSLDFTKQLSNLRGLIVKFNKINYIGLSENLTNLFHLELSCNQISDISPLSKFGYLEYIDLSGNQISDISPLSSLANIWHLDLFGNQISDLSPLYNLTYLSDLSIWGNEAITQSQIDELKQKLPDCQINF